jgi:signal transduction histidine kinase
MPQQRLRAELTEVAAPRARLAGAFEAELRRIERDLHDGAQQKLVALTMQLRLARLDLPPGWAAAQGVTTAHEQAKQLMADLRDLITGNQPQILTGLGLTAALSELADQAPIPVTVYSALSGRLPGQAENVAYFAAAEALTNVAKHSGAGRRQRDQRDRLPRGARRAVRLATSHPGRQPAFGVVGVVGLDAVVGMAEQRRGDQEVRAGPVARHGNVPGDG